MDEPDLDATRHDAALSGLARLNALSRSAHLLWRPIHAMMRSNGLDRVSILDVACGAGDNPIRIHRLAQQCGVEVTLSGCDFSAQAIRHALARSEACNVSAQWVLHDVLKDDLPGEPDVVMCSLFLHHLTRGEQLILIERMKKAARRMIVIVDLRRCRAGYLLALTASQLLTRSDVVHVDALRSVSAALTIAEVVELFADAGMNEVQMRRCRPFRWVATWERKES